uniref:cystatin-like n=1 Tax=Pristiophorus japonicus TaxID=55135 RepID=UPI00398EE458
MGARTRVGAVLAAALLVCASACSQLPPEPVPGEAGWRLRPPGALEPVSLTDPDMLKAVWFAVAEYNKASNNIYVHKMVRVVSAQRQIVSGIKYVLEVEVGKTQCRQGEVDDLDSCALCVHPQNKLCNFEVLSVAWTQTLSLEKSMCRPSN